jgi:hypothetical protein
MMGPTSFRHGASTFGPGCNDYAAFRNLTGIRNTYLGEFCTAGAKVWSQRGQVSVVGRRGSAQFQQ